MRVGNLLEGPVCGIFCYSFFLFFFVSHVYVSFCLFFEYAFEITAGFPAETCLGQH